MKSIVIKLLACFRYVNPARHPIEQTESIVFFQFTDGKADGGLGQMQFFSGFRNTFALIYGDENTDVAKCHNPVLSRLKYENT